MFDDLDKTLHAVLTQQQAPQDLREAEIGFVTPTQDYAPSSATVNLFLHDVTESESMLGHRRPRTVEETRVVEPQEPFWVDCAYLVTAWSVQAGEERTAVEHRLLSTAMVWLSLHPVVDPALAVGSLAGSRDRTVLEVARTAEGERLGQFWTALGIAPRPAFSLKVTVPLRLSTADLVLPRVKAVHVAAGTPDAPVLSGALLDAKTLEPLAGTVAVEGLVTATQVDGTGHFTFPDVEPGVRVLLAEVPGRPQHRAEITFTARTQVHNLLIPVDAE